MITATHDIILFDGVCNLCSSAVQFIIRHDKKARFKFASLQSAVANDILQQYKAEIKDPLQSILLIRNDKIYNESSAILRIAQDLSGAWPVAAVFLIVPKFIRDLFYKIIARNRYKWFGKKEACMVPTPDIAARFL